MGMKAETRKGDLLIEELENQCRGVKDLLNS